MTDDEFKRALETERAKHGLDCEGNVARVQIIELVGGPHDGCRSCVHEWCQWVIQPTERGDVDDGKIKSVGAVYERVSDRRFQFARWL